MNSHAKLKRFVKYFISYAASSSKVLLAILGGIVFVVAVALSFAALSARNKR